MSFKVRGRSFWQGGDFLIDSANKSRVTRRSVYGLGWMIRVRVKIRVGQEKAGFRRINIGRRK
jgi:hypothetical protein